MNEGFVALVAEMRALQKNWFAEDPKDIPPDLFRKCTAAEQRVDRAIQGYVSRERKLFEG